MILRYVLLSFLIVCLVANVGWAQQTGTRPKTRLGRPQFQNPSDTSRSPQENAPSAGSMEVIGPNHYRLTDANGKQRSVVLNANLLATYPRFVKVLSFTNSSGERFERTKKDPQRWMHFLPNGQRNKSDFFGDIEVVDGRDIRMTDSMLNQMSLFKLDGGWQWDLFTEDVLPPGDVRRPQRRHRFTIRRGLDGVTELVDHNVGHTYSTNAFYHESLLKRNTETGTLSYVDWNNYLITIEDRDDPDTAYAEQGKRTMRSRGGVGAGQETDAGGRLVREFDSNGKTTWQYQYGYSNGRAVLEKFRNSKGTFQKFPQSDGRERWNMVGVGVPRNHGFSADALWMNCDRDVVVEDGEKTTLQRTDGSSITVRTGRNDDGSLEKAISVANHDGIAAYSVTERSASDGTVTRREFTSVAGHFSTDDGITWYEHDETGDRVEGSKAYGRVEIAESPSTRDGIRVEAGALIKTAFVTKSTDDQHTVSISEQASDRVKPAIGELVLDRDGEPKFKEVAVINTRGQAFQHFAHGGEICRYPGGDILFTIDANRKKTWLNYVSENGKRGSIDAIERSDATTGEQLGMIKWKTVVSEDGREVGYFVSDEGKKLFFGHRVTADGAHVAEEANEYAERKVSSYFLDGTTSVKDFDGYFTLRDRKGRTLLERRADGLEVRLEFDPESGAIARIDLPGKSVVLDTYEPDENHPLPEGIKVYRTDKIHIDDGDGSFRHLEAVAGSDDDVTPPTTVRFTHNRLGQSVITRLWVDGSLSEHVRSDQGLQLTRSVDSNGNELVVERDERGTPVRVDVRPYQSASKGSSQPTLQFTIVAKDDSRKLPEVTFVAADVEAKSSLTVTDNSQGKNWVEFINNQGDSVRIYLDGSREHRRDDQVTEVWDILGERTILAYDDGILTSVIGPHVELRQKPDGSVKIETNKAGAVQQTQLDRFDLSTDVDRTVIRAFPHDGAVAVESFDLRRAESQLFWRDKTFQRLDAKGHILHELDGKFDEFEYYYWDDGTSTRVGITDGTKQDLDASGRITYERNSRGEERHVAYGKGESRRETAADSTIKDFDEQGRLRYQRDVDGGEWEHFYLENDHHVIRRLAAKETRLDNKGKKSFSTTTFEPDPTDTSLERIIHHESQEGRNYFVRYHDQGERRDERIAMYIVGDEKKTFGRPTDSLVEFDKHGRMTYRREADNTAATFYYSNTSATDFQPIVVEDDKGKWVRGENLWDGSSNYRWTVAKDGKTTEHTGTFRVARFQQQKPFKTTDEPQYTFVVLPKRKPMLAEGQDQDDLRNGVKIIRHAGNQEIFEISQPNGVSYKFAEAPVNANLPRDVQAVASVAIHGDGSMEIRHHDGRVDQRHRAGTMLYIDSKGILVAVSSPSGETFTIDETREGTVVKELQVVDTGTLNVFELDGDITTIDRSGNMLRYAGLNGGKGVLTSVAGADGKSTLNFIQSDNDERLESVQRITQDPLGTKHYTALSVDKNGIWTDGDSNYDTLWVAQGIGEVNLLNDRVWRTIKPDGTEVEKHYSSTVWLPHGVSSSPRPTIIERDSMGQILATSTRTITGFIWNDGQIVSVLEGDTGIVKLGDGVWMPSELADDRVKAKLHVTHDGSQRWIGENGTVRTHLSEGRVQVRRTDGSGFTISPNGLQVLHRHGPKSSVDTVVTHEGGLITVKMKDGSRYACNPNLRPGEVWRSDRESVVTSTFSGAINISSDGTVTLATFPAGLPASPPRSEENESVEDGGGAGASRNIHPLAGAWEPGTQLDTRVRVFHRNGPVSEFIRRQVLTGAVWISDHDLQLTDLNQVGAVNPSQNVAGVAMFSGGTDQPQTRGLDEIALITFPRMAGRLGVSQDWLHEQVKSGTIPVAKEGSDDYLSAVAVHDALVARIETPQSTATTLARIEQIKPRDIVRLAGPLLTPIEPVSPVTPSKSVSFANSKWGLSYKKGFEIVMTLNQDGTAQFQPASPASGKDTWKSPDGTSITIDCQRGYLSVTYEGKLMDADTIEGEARDRQGNKWPWTAKRQSAASDEAKTKSSEVSTPDKPSPDDHPFLDAARKGDLGAQYQIGDYYYKNGELTEAQRWFEKAAAGGSENAERRLRQIKYQLARRGRIKTVPTPSSSTHGKGTDEPQPVKKHPMLSRAENGDPVAQFEIGVDHFLRKEMDEARKWLQKAADQGFAPAKGFLLRLGSKP